MNRGQLILNLVSEKCMAEKKIFLLVNTGVPRSLTVCVLILNAYFKFTIRNIPCAMSRGYVIAIYIYIYIYIYIIIICMHV